MAITRHDFKKGLTDITQEYKNKLSDYFKNHYEDLIKEKSHADAIVCGQMYFSTQDSITQALRKLDYNF